MMWLNIDPSWKITKIRNTPLFFKIHLCSTTSMESSRRDLLNDVAEHMSILKNDQNTHYPRFSFTPKTGIAFPLTVVLFLLRRFPNPTCVSLMYSILVCVSLIIVSHLFSLQFLQTMLRRVLWFADLQFDRNKSDAVTSRRWHFIHRWWTCFLMRWLWRMSTFDWHAQSKTEEYQKKGRLFS